MDNIILTQIPKDSLLLEIKQIIEAALQEEKLIEIEERLISPAAACKIFEPSISLPTLAAWTKAGHLESKKIGHRVYYNKKQILQAGITLKKYKQNQSISM